MGSEMKWKQLLSDERLGHEKTTRPYDGRSPFQIDLDRIVFSQPFRRLQDKTQVHPMPPNDHVRRRLTHSIEVSVVGRSLATAVAPTILARNNKLPLTKHDFGYILQAACHAHDIGNPPFGHFGEEAIRHFFKDSEKELKRLGANLKKDQWADLQNYEGNAHGFRILTRKESHTTEKGLSDGLLLTVATLGAFMKYPCCSYSGRGVSRKKFGFFKDDSSNAMGLFKTLGLLPRKRDRHRWVRAPLAYLLEAADDITYSLADFEDGVELDIVTQKEYEDILHPLVSSTSPYWKIGKTDRRGRREALRGAVIGSLIQQVRDVFLDYEQQLLQGKFPGTESSPDGSLLDKIHSAGDIAAIKEFSRERIYSARRKVRIEVASYEIIGVVLHKLTAAALRENQGKPTNVDKRLLVLLGSTRPKRGESPYQVLLNTADHVAGMTDSFVHQLYLHLRGISL